jgi:unsaturated rhamnogalacturonyl hydrolase
MTLIRREVLLGAGALTLATAAGAKSKAPLSPSPRVVGAKAAAAWLAADIRPLKSKTHWGVHYSDVACAYGAARFAAATGDTALLNRIKDRYVRAETLNIDNTQNHVDVSVYGAWPLEMAIRTSSADLLRHGLAYADRQWAAVTPDGLTTQARYWIDDVWMIGALQIQAFSASRDAKYLDRAALMARLYMDRLQQPNGLFFHGPNAQFHWARGNGWVAAGLAELLSELPATHKDYPAVMDAYTRMMAGLLKHQADDGMWRQLIDYPDVWKETSGTAMFAYAMVVGVRRGILTDPAYTDAYRKAWTQLATYVEPDGSLREVCVGTGQSKTPDYYIARPRQTGDFHGQAPLLWFATALVT